MKPSSWSARRRRRAPPPRGPYWPEDRMISSIGSIPASSSAQNLGVQPVVLAGGAGEVPGVHEHVGGVELVDRAVQRQLADVRVGQTPGRPSPDRPAPPGRRRGAPPTRPTGSSSTRGPGGSLMPAPAARKPGTTRRGGARRRGRSSPSTGAGASQSVAPAPGRVNVAGDLRCRSAGSLRQRAIGQHPVELGVTLVDADLHAAGQPRVAALEAVDQRGACEPRAAVAEVLEPQRLQARRRPGMPS